MHPHLRAALAIAALAALGSAGGRPGRLLVHRLGAAAADAPGEAQPSALCPEGTLPDRAHCVPFEQARATSGAALSEQKASHHDRRGQLKVYDQIPRLPDRPESYAAYRYPIDVPRNGAVSLSGYDLDRPDDEQRRGKHLSAVGHGGVDLPGKRGAEVRMVPLEHQDGDAEVLHVGPLFGLSVVTAHVVQEAGRPRDYVVIFGHLDGFAPGLEKGVKLREGDLLGFVGDTGSEGVVHLHLEVRRAREGVDPRTTLAGRLIANERTVAVDPRNVLPLVQQQP